jgi:hypothetical protein
LELKKLNKRVKNTKNQKGQSLVEVVIAIALIAIVFSGSWQILHDSFFSISQEAVAVKAHYLVVEGLEGIRSIRGENWTAVADGTWHFRYDESDPNNKVVRIETGEETVFDQFTRRIEISSVRRDTTTGKITEDISYEIDENTKQVQVVVQWKYKGVTRTDMETIYLTNWAGF